jgi:uncharacterized protein (DUF427 family)
MKIPGPDHPITIALHPGRIKIVAAEEVIAETMQALVLKESRYQPVFYIPREDVDFRNLMRTDRSTYCPYKGDASYFSIQTAQGMIDNAIWTYEQPYPAVAQIAGYLAFYPSKVTIEQLPV